MPHAAARRRGSLLRVDQSAQRKGPFKHQSLKGPRLAPTDRQVQMFGNACTTEYTRCAPRRLMLAQCQDRDARWAPLSARSAWPLGLASGPVRGAGAALLPRDSRSRRWLGLQAEDGGGGVAEDAVALGG